MNNLEVTDQDFVKKKTAEGREYRQTDRQEWEKPKMALTGAGTDRKQDGLDTYTMVKSEREADGDV